VVSVSATPCETCFRSDIPPIALLPAVETLRDSRETRSKDRSFVL